MFESPWTWLASIGILLFILSVSRKLFQWYFGITEIKRLIEEQNSLLKLEFEALSKDEELELDELRSKARL